MALRKDMQSYLKSLKVKNGKKFSLKMYNTDYDKKMISKEEGEEVLRNGVKRMASLQDKLYADDHHSLLIVLQAMDAAGKDSVIKHVMSGFNPQGVKVASFKTPTNQELDHDYFWRHYKELPGKGEIGIFNRSHYENVLITKVHPEYLVNERLPNYKSAKDIDKNFWAKRYKQINRFEKNLSENGTLIIKFFLHVSKEEQKKRFLERIDNPEKNWKFSLADANERKYWDQYQQAYEKMMKETSQDYAPWYVLPADDKWFTRICVGAVILFELEKLKLKYPAISEDQKKQLLLAKEELLAEEQPSN
jgi:PPK2 family polyphosphate:nucleotide phosphotransferase